MFRTVDEFAGDVKELAQDEPEAADGRVVREVDFLLLGLVLDQQLHSSLCFELLWLGPLT